MKERGLVALPVAPAADDMVLEGMIDDMLRVE
jgi:hypothetical protein